MRLAKLREVWLGTTTDEFGMERICWSAVCTAVSVGGGARATLSSYYLTRWFYDESRESSTTQGGGEGVGRGYRGKEAETATGNVATSAQRGYRHNQEPGYAVSALK